MLTKESFSCEIINIPAKAKHFVFYLLFIKGIKVNICSFKVCFFTSWLMEQCTMVTGCESKPGMQPT